MGVSAPTLQGGGGRYPQTSSPSTNIAVSRFLLEHGGLPCEVVDAAKNRSIAEAVRALTNLQGCQLWEHCSSVSGLDLTREQRELIGHGSSGPAVDLEGISLTLEQVPRRLPKGRSVHVFMNLQLLCAAYSRCILLLRMRMSESL